MKEQIYTIPVNEAYDADCECPMCLLESNLEKETLDYTLGAAMMEPDFRENSNKKGYCKKTGKLMVDVNPQFFRPAEVELLWGDSSKAEKELGWQRKVSFHELVKMMVQDDCEKAKV